MSHSLRPNKKSRHMLVDLPHKIIESFVLFILNEKADIRSFRLLFVDIWMLKPFTARFINDWQPLKFKL